MCNAMTRFCNMLCNAMPRFCNMFNFGRSLKWRACEVIANTTQNNEKVMNFVIGTLHDIKLVTFFLLYRVSDNMCTVPSAMRTRKKKRRN